MYFVLPDKFEGSFPDALRLLADYLETPTKKLKKGNGAKFCSHTIWDEFLKTVKAGGKTLGRKRLLMWDTKKKKWVNIHKNSNKGIKFKKAKR